MGELSRLPKLTPPYTRAMARVSVVVVEDDSFTRSLLVQSLRSLEVAVLADTAEASRALELCRTHVPDVALLDLDLGPGPTGFHVAVALRRQQPQIGIVMLTSYLDPRLLHDDAPTPPVGARFLRKTDLESPVQLVKTVLATKRAPLLPQRPDSADGPMLTARQREVLKQVVAGHSSREIALSLGVSDKAVEASLSRIQKIVDPPGSQGHGTRVKLVRAYYSLTGRTPPRA